MPSLGDAAVGRASQMRIPNSEEIDFDRLRADRLARLQAAMAARDVPVALLFNQANIRYATGTTAMTQFSSTAFARCCVVPVTGSPVLFENRGSLHVARRTFENVRQMPFKGEFESEGGENFSGSMIAVLNSMGMKGERVALDAIDSRRLLALLAEKFTFVDSGPIIADASEVKTIDEIAIFKLNGAIGDAMLYDFESAIHPGIREHELLAVLAESLYRNHGEGLFTRFVGSGRNTNPWMSEAHDKMVMPGDLVAVDTDANGYQGYVIDISRTFLCGTNPTAGQREAYRVAYEAVRGMTELLKPGLSYEEFARLVPRLPERFRERRYGIMVHSAWLEDGPLGIPYVEDVEDGRFDFPDRTILPGMVLCLECYAGAVDEAFGVKLEDQVLVTDSGCELLSTYPYDARLLGA